MALSIRLSSDEERRLETLAQRTGRTKSFYVREAISEHLAELEERFWAEDVIDQWEDAGSPSHEAQKLWGELGV